LHRLLLGIMDKGRLTLGDNTLVNFERTLVFLTSNVGAKEMAAASSPNPFTFDQSASSTVPNIRAIGEKAMERKFPPEFCNRVDVISVFEPLSTEALAQIMDLELNKLRDFVVSRLGGDSPVLVFMPSAKEFLLERGTSAKFGARELKRALFKYVTFPLAKMTNAKTIQGRQVVVTGGKGKDELTFEVKSLTATPSKAAA
jgi:ATP-dependent Clp protease ATP-binding subunit ClpA